jgi:predicted transglutaminase-like cysteine proteinase
MRLHPADNVRHLRLACSRATRRAALLIIGLCVLAGPALTQGVDLLRMQRAAVLAGPRAETSVRDLQALLQASRALPPEAQLQAVNRFFNSRILFTSDQEVWGQLDYWASPLETLAKGVGDCEDYAIAKYFSLLALGMPAARLRLVYVRAMLDGRSQAHMVLGYYPEEGDDVLVLDNLQDQISPAARRVDLKPVFSFNTEGLWQGVGAVAARDPSARLSRWLEVTLKARNEGFH